MSGTIKNKKTAIILFNLGGPDSKKAVKPFLFNLFNDKNIITLPGFFRYIVAWIISSRREREAQEIYGHIGGKSPILDETKNQAKALKTKLQEDGFTCEVFICMRHWHPMSDEVIKDVEQYSPEEIILLPLYPQFSTTTTKSSIEDFIKKQERTGIKNIPRKIICCYPNDFSYVDSHVSLIKKAISSIKDKNNFRILFSAHGLPEKIIKDGDPYQWQINNNVKEIVSLLGENIDYKITYQSKVGPLKWLEPNTEEEIKEAGKTRKELIIVPIAFVSEHSETLVELDIEYKEIADNYKINYIRVPTLSVDKLFIKSLSDIVKNASKKEEGFVGSSNMSRICPSSYNKCPCKG